MHPVLDEDAVEFATALRKREITPAQWERFEGYAAEILTAFGLDLNSPSTERTPQRFVRALFDSTQGYDGDPKLITAFPAECRGGSDCELSQVVEGPIRFYSLCEHHALPFYGDVYVAYVAHEHILGISKLTRLVRVFARRFSVQERLGQQIADALVSIVEPHGVAVYAQAHHLCVQMRGVREDQPSTRTTTWRGVYENDPALRAEFLSICGQRQRPLP